MDLSALERSISNLERSLDSVELWLAVSTLLVVLGLILEYWHDVIELIALIKNRPPFPWRKLQAMIGGVLVTVGVAGELALQFHASRIETGIRFQSHQIEAILSKGAAEANKEAGLARAEAAASNLTATGFESKIADSDARAKAAEAQVASAKAASLDAVARVAAAEARSVEASAKAEAFRRDIAIANESAAKAEARAAEASLELARFKAPRTLSPSQQASIGGRLRKLGSQRVDVILIGDAQEIGNVAGMIAAAIQRAGWTTTFFKAISGPNSSGVFVGTHTGSNRNVNDAAEALIAVLESNGITCGRLTQFGDELPMAVMGPTWNTNNIAPIRMLISAKP